MKVVTAEEMRQIDKQTIEEIGIPGIVLMETAATAVFRSIQRNFPECRRVRIIIGKGNNGGDGLALARQLTHAGFTVQMLLVSSAERFTGDALTNLQVVRRLGFPIMEVLSEADLKSLAKEIGSCDLIVDAIFGTGLRGVIEGHIKVVIDWLNSAKFPVMAIDLPSGLNADTGVVEGACIRRGPYRYARPSETRYTSLSGSTSSRRVGNCRHRVSTERNRISRNTGELDTTVSSRQLDSTSTDLFP